MTKYRLSEVDITKKYQLNTNFRVKVEKSLVAFE